MGFLGGVQVSVSGYVTLANPEPANDERDPLADAFRDGTFRELSDALVLHIARTFAVRAPEGVTEEWLVERARNAVAGFLDLVSR